MKFILLAFLISSTAFSGTFTAATCNQSDVNAVINGGTHTAVDGDIIQIPAGSCTWTSGISVPSNIGITIIGSGTPNSTPSTIGASASCASGTTITITGAKAFAFTPSFGNSTTRLSCIQLTYGSGASIGMTSEGTCTSGGCPNLRMDNITFTNWTGHASAGISYGINAIGDMFGVLDHNTLTGDGSSYLQLIEFSHGAYLGVGQYGDNAWAQPEDWGTNKFIYFENNTFISSGASENEGDTGAYENRGGGRIVGRFNTFSIADSFNVPLAWHGTESGSRTRSTRAFEFYGNTYTCTPGNFCGTVVGSRGGNGLVWGNTMNHASAGLNNVYFLSTFRANASFGSWTVCDGSSPYDIDDGVTYYSGTVGSVSGSNPATITVSGGSPGWTTSQWVVNGAPYSVHDVTQATGAEISASGSNTLTINVGSGAPADWTPANGDSIQILRATACVDQAGGRGAGTLYSGLIPSPASSSAQAAVPEYIWSNTLNDGATSFPYVGSNTLRVIANRDFYMESVSQAAQSNSSTPFDGTSTIGMGHGTLANRPTTCTAGVGYFATDQGSWNTSGSGGQGLLYKCTSTDTWTLNYTPYTYPHPLTSQAVGGGSSSSGPRARSGPQSQ